MPPPVVRWLHLLRGHAGEQVNADHLFGKQALDDILAAILDAQFVLAGVGAKPLVAQRRGRAIRGCGGPRGDPWRSAASR